METMIFKQIQEIIDGTKTQTRRIVKPGEYSPLTGLISVTHAVRTAEDRLKWQTGRDYAVSPGRGKPGAMWNGQTQWVLPHSGTHPTESTPRGFQDRGYKPLRIVITAIRREPLQSITPEDVRAEGVWCDVDYEPLDIGFSPDLHNWDVYRALWNDINTRKGTRWEDNPDVWVIEFEVQK